MEIPESFLRGVLPPLATPFDARGDLDLAALQHNVERYERAGLAGYVCFGSNGEAVHLDADERQRILQTVRAAAEPARAVVAGINEQSTRAAITACRRAHDAGADAALVITPFYYKSAMTQEALARFFLDVADSSPVPIVLYKIPQATGVALDATTIAELARHENVAGVKDSSGDLRALGEILRLAPDGFRVLVGSADLLFEGLVMGAAGGILAVANLAPDATVDLCRAQRDGDLQRARELQRHLTPLAAAVTTDLGVPGLKHALDLLGYRGGTVRGPLLALGEPQRRRLRALLDVNPLVELEAPAGAAEATGAAPSPRAAEAVRA